MPHIHIQPDQHDMTVSAYIIMREGEEWKCLVHMHRKFEKLLQIGGHIELDETPWQSMAHEIEEESGFKLAELDVLQFNNRPLKTSGNINHPTPISLNTHYVGDDHYHSDLMFGFIASSRPRQLVSEGEADDLRWLTLEQLQVAAVGGSALTDVYEAYAYILNNLDSYTRMAAHCFSTDKPTNGGLTYKSGKPSDERA